LIPTLTKKYSEVIARELDEAISAGCIAAGIPPSALQNPQRKAALELIARNLRVWPTCACTRTRIAAIRRSRARS
jgi:hypothetical protein